MSTERRLQRGLGELLQVSAWHNQVDGSMNALSQMVPIGALSPREDQPRKHFSEQALHELSESIGQHGILSPILVRPAGKNKWQIVAGERRWRAANQASLVEVPVIVKELDDHQVHWLALVENIQRQDLNAMEQAEAIAALHQETEMNHEQLAKTIGKSRAYVTNMLRLTQMMPELKQAVRDGQLEMGHARALAPLAPEVVLKLLPELIQEKYSVRQVEELTQRHLQKVPHLPRKQQPHFIELKPLLKSINQRLGVDIKIKHNHGNPKVSIVCADDKQLEKVILALHGPVESDLVVEQ